MRRRARALRRRYGRAYPPAYAPKGSRYEIFVSYPKMRGGGFEKKRRLVGRGRDAYEALARLYEVEHDQTGSRRPLVTVIDQGSRRGRLAAAVTSAELRRRQAEGG